MSFVEKHLLNGERVTFQTHLHWKVYTVPVLLSLVVFAPLAYWAGQSVTHRVLMAIPIAAAVVAFFTAFVRRRSSEFAVTNKRVIVKIGALSTRSVELLLPKVEGITVNQNLMGKLLGYGEIVITGSGGTRETFVGIQHPFEFRRAVQAATDTGSTAS